MIWLWPGGPGARHRQTDCELATPCMKNAHAHSRLVNVGIMRWAGRSGRPGAGHHHGALHNGRLQDPGRMGFIDLRCTQHGFVVRTASTYPL